MLISLGIKVFIYYPTYTLHMLIYKADHLLIEKKT